MIFVVGWGPHRRDLGPADWRTCARCGCHARWREVEVSQRLSVFFVPLLHSGRARWIVCPQCGTGFPREDEP